MNIHHAARNTLAFPGERCCNCGTTAGVGPAMQETHLTRYFLFFGVETTMTLPLAACHACAPTLKRKPPTWFTRGLVWLLITAVLFLALAIAGPDKLPFGLGESLFTTCLVIAAALTAGIAALRRPRGAQTSHFQPVRLVAVDRAFGSGDVVGLRLKFTNADYLRDFLALNAESVRAGAVRGELAK